jgi:hypothetical protein
MTVWIYMTLAKKSETLNTKVFANGRRRGNLVCGKNDPDGVAFE